MSLFPVARFDTITVAQANDALLRWGHKMGPLNRPYHQAERAHGLFYNEDLAAVVTTSALISANVGGGLGHLTRRNTLELSRLCASRPGICRVALRLYRDLVIPTLPASIVISYQDADMHSGNTYRFDGWELIGHCRAGGDDPRSGRKARNRNVWAWPHGACIRLEAQAA